MEQITPLKNLCFLFRNNRDAIRWMEDFGLLRGNRICPGCQAEMPLVERPTTVDGYEYRCRTAACKGRRVSVRLGSFFAGSSVRLLDFMIVIYEWSQGSSVLRQVREAEVSKGFVIKINKELRQFVIDWTCEDRPLIGGEGCVVEIDETNLIRRKYNRGRVSAGNRQWLVGGVCRSSQEIFFRMVERRNVGSLTDCITSNVRRGTTIITDEWAGYRRLDRVGYIHRTVNHSENFVNPDDPSVHTQTIEGLWSILKGFLKTKGPNRTPRLDAYLAEFLFRRFDRSTVFRRILEALAAATEAGKFVRQADRSTGPQGVGL